MFSAFQSNQWEGWVVFDQPSVCTLGKSRSYAVKHVTAFPNPDFNVKTLPTWEP